MERLKNLKNIWILIVFWILYILIVTYKKRIDLSPELMIELILMGGLITIFTMVFMLFLDKKYTMLIILSSVSNSIWVMYWWISLYGYPRKILYLVPFVLLFGTAISYIFSKRKMGKEISFLKFVGISVLICAGILIIAVVVMYVIYWLLPY